MISARVEIIYQADLGARQQINPGNSDILTRAHGFYVIQVGYDKIH